MKIPKHNINTSANQRENVERYQIENPHMARNYHQDRALRGVPQTRSDAAI
jgi:hypothetical protein